MCQVSAADVLQFLEVVGIRQKGAEPLDRFVVAFLGAETALAVVAGQLVQLTYQGQIKALVVNVFCHL